MDQSITVGITGGSGSGKTFFLQSLSAHFKKHEICLISQDNYYKTREEQPLDENGVRNFDLPAAIDNGTFLQDLIQLKAGHDVVRKEYTFNNPTTEPKILKLKAAPIIIAEGLFIMYFKEIEHELDLKLFIEANHDVKLARRIKRDQVERGYDMDDVLYRYQHHVMPVFDAMIEPLKDRADLVIPNNGPVNPALDVLVLFLKARLKGLHIHL